MARKPEPVEQPTGTDARTDAGVSDRIRLEAIRALEYSDELSESLLHTYRSLRKTLQDLRLEAAILRSQRGGSIAANQSVAAEVAADQYQLNEGLAGLTKELRRLIAAVRTDLEDLRSKAQRNESQPIRKTVLVVDLVKSTTTTRLYQELLGDTGPGTLDKQVLTFIENSLEMGDFLQRAEREPAGDGVKLYFEGANDAHQFAQAFYRCVDQRNRDKTQRAARWAFRVGAATGMLTWEVSEGGMGQWSGMPKIVSARLVVACKPGELLIDRDTYQSLDPRHRASYAKEVTISGKPGETYKARRCRMAAHVS
jgi:class 3 adenylate cyclase